MADEEINEVTPEPEDEPVSPDEDEVLPLTESEPVSPGEDEFEVLPFSPSDSISPDEDEVLPVSKSEPVSPDEDELLPLTESELATIEAEEAVSAPDEPEPVASDAGPPAPPAGVPNSRSPTKVFWYQVLSGTLYGVYWFFRNYKQFATHKKLDVKPAVMALVLYAATGAIITIPNYFETTVWVDLSCMFTATGIYCWFFYRQFLLVTGFLAGLGYKHLHSPKRLVFVLGLAFLFPSLLTLVVRSDTSLHFMGVFLMAMLICAAISGWVLSKVQEVLNFIWTSHQKRSYNRLVVTPVATGEKIFIGVLYIFGVFAILAYLSGAILLLGDATFPIDLAP